MGLMLLLALMALQPAQDDGPMVTAPQAEACTLNGQPVACPPESEHPPVRQPTAEEVAEQRQQEADLQVWLANYRADDTPPDWKTDPQGWVAHECRAATSELMSDCEGRARTQLVQLRAADINARPIADPLPSPRRDDGVSFSTGLSDDTERSSPRSQGYCDAPVAGETNDAWVARCPPGGGPRRD